MSRLKYRALECQLVSVIVALAVAIIPGSAGDLAREVAYGENGLIVGAMVLLAATIIWMTYGGWWLSLLDFFAASIIAVSAGRFARFGYSPDRVIPFADTVLASAMIGILAVTLIIASLVLRAKPWRLIARHSFLG